MVDGSAGRGRLPGRLVRVPRLAVQATSFSRAGSKAPDLQTTPRNREPCKSARFAVHPPKQVAPLFAKSGYRIEIEGAEIKEREITTVEHDFGVAFAPVEMANALEYGIPSSLIARRHRLLAPSVCGPRIQLPRKLNAALFESDGSVLVSVIDI